MNNCDSDLYVLFRLLGELQILDRIKENMNEYNDALSRFENIRARRLILLAIENPNAEERLELRRIDLEIDDLTAIKYSKLDLLKFRGLLKNNV